MFFFFPKAKNLYLKMQYLKLQSVHKYFLKWLQEISFLYSSASFFVPGQWTLGDSG